MIGKLNTLFLRDLNIFHARLQLKGPDFRDPLEIAKVLGPFIQAGAVSANDLRDLAGRVLGKTLDEWPEEEFSRPLGYQQSAKRAEAEAGALLPELQEVVETLKQITERR